MTVAERDFKMQVMETFAQWNSGLRSRLALDGDGLSLFANPAFDSFLVTKDLKRGAGDIVVDECGQIYWTEFEPTQETGESGTWILSRFNPSTREVELVLRFAGCRRIEPRELWLSPDYLWVFDHPVPEANDVAGPREGRVLAMSRENYQIVYELVISKVFDVDLDHKRGFLYALVEGDDGEKQICSYSIPPFPERPKECSPRKVGKQRISSRRPGTEECFVLELKEPVALAVGRNGFLYVLDIGLGRFIRIDPSTKERTQLGGPQEVLLKSFRATSGKPEDDALGHPAFMQIDERGVIFLGSSGIAKLHMFDEDGSYLGEAELPASINSISGIGFDQTSGVYLATDQGFARFSLAKSPVGQEGVFYSKTLDNGNPESFWHRVALSGRIPSKSSVQVCYFTSDNSSLKAAYDGVLREPGSVEEKKIKLEKLLGKSWIGRETFTGSDAPENELTGSLLPGAEAIAEPDLLLNPNKGRFLWLKLTLITFDRDTRPSIQSARIYYPRLSYLRYLPPAYREDLVSAAFLERFLSLFETVFEGLDQKIDQLFHYFDSSLAPKEFLLWLGSWINLLLDDDIQEEQVRQFIRRAPSLYGRKGTPEALVEFLEIYTGRPVSLTEYLRGLNPLVLGGPDFKVGQGTFLLGAGPSGMRLGDTTIVGHAALRDRVSDPDEPFLSLARRFTVVIDMDPAEFKKREATLRRIVAEQKPAHTSCTIRLAAGQNEVGVGVLGGVKVTDTRPYRVGVTPLGSASSVARNARVLRLERGAWVGSSKRL